MPAPKGTRLEKRGDRWYILWTGNTRGRSTGTGDRSAAEAALAEFIAERARGDDADDALTVSAALQFYFDERVKEKVVASDRQELIRLHVEAFFGTMVASAIDSEDVTAYCAWRRAGNGGAVKNRKAKNPTLRRELGMLTSALNHCAKTKRMKRDALPHIDLPAGSVPRDLWLHEAECDVLLRACLPGEAGTWQAAVAATEEVLPRVFKFVLIGLEAAARKKSIERLTKFQVDRGVTAINFNPPGARQSKKRRPVVPVSDRLRPYLERFLKETTTEFVLGSPGSVRTPFLNAVKRAAKTLEERGDVEGAARMRRVIPHTLRHTWATLAAQNRVSMFDIAGVLGDSEATVRKTYAHHHPDYLRGAVNFRAAPAAAKEEVR